MDEMNLSPDGSGLREELYNNWRLYAGVAGIAVLTGVEIFRRFGGASSPRPKTPRNKVVTPRLGRDRVDETPSPAKSPKAASGLGRDRVNATTSREKITKAADAEEIVAEPEPEPVTITEHEGVIENFVVSNGVTKYGFILYEEGRIFFHVKEAQAELFEFQSVTFEAMKDPYQSGNSARQLKAVNVKPSKKPSQGRVVFIEQRSGRGIIQPSDSRFERLSFMPKTMAGNGVGKQATATEVLTNIPLEVGCLVEYEHAKEQGRRARIDARKIIALNVKVIEKAPETSEAAPPLSPECQEGMARSLAGRPPPTAANRRRSSPDAAQSEGSWRLPPRRNSWRERDGASSSTSLAGSARQAADRDRNWRRGSRSNESSPENDQTQPVRYARPPQRQSPGFRMRKLSPGEPEHSGRPRRNSAPPSAPSPTKKSPPKAPPVVRG